MTNQTTTRSHWATLFSAIEAGAVKVWDAFVGDLTPTVKALGTDIATDLPAILEAGGEIAAGYVMNNASWETDGVTKFWNVATNVYQDLQHKFGVNNPNVTLPTAVMISQAAYLKMKTKAADPRYAERATPTPA